MTKNVNFQIYPSITTTQAANWGKMVSDVSRLNLKEVCLFLTVATLAKRKEIYQALEGSSIKTIPLVHLRGDMKVWEVEYLMKRFGTKMFNVHSSKEHKLNPGLGKYSKKYIALELTSTPVEDELDGYAGICLDTTHVENNLLSKSPLYNSFMDCLSRYPVKVWHVSAIKKKKFYWAPTRTWMHDAHRFRDLSEFDYVKKYKKYLAPIIALELVNPIEDQLRVKEYVMKLLTL